jgi:predicted dehydrogenase
MASKTHEKIRYAVVGAGWIAQQWFMPAVAHTGNSLMTALVTGDPKKGEVLGKRYGIKAYGYDAYETLLKSRAIDAIYLALPNSMHREYAVKALQAGIHVLLEKPMAVSVDECEAIRAAAEGSGAKLMIAYRLHFEPATLAAIDLVHKGKLGTVRFFSSAFSQNIHPSNHRAKNGFWAGPVADMGPYPINAARNLFAAEPLEVWAVGAQHPDVNFDFADTVSVTLRFSEERLAQFTVSYSASAVDQYRIVGSGGDLEISPAYGMESGLVHHLNMNGKEKWTREFPRVDHFGGELKYFSDCILEKRDPEPDGEEGLADVRVIAAIERALASGKPEKLPAFQRKKRPELTQRVELPAVQLPELVNAATPEEQLPSR